MSITSEWLMIVSPVTSPEGPLEDAPLSGVALLLRLREAQRVMKARAREVTAEMEAEDERDAQGDVMARWYVEDHGFDWSCPAGLDGHMLVRGDDNCPKCEETDDGSRDEEGTGPRADAEDAGGA